MNELLLQAVIYLGAGVVAVPIAHRLGLGSVLGYLLAGIAIAPLLDWLGSDPEDVQHFAEFGVVMMLFLIGLELQPRLLWQMRTRLFGLGGMQVAVTGLAVGFLCMAFGLDWRLAAALGMILSLSSTAIVLQTLGEKSWLRTEGGQSAFSVLLFQDIAVIPMLALLPFLATPGMREVALDAAQADGGSPLAEWPAWMQGLSVLAAFAVIVLGGRYLTRPAFRIIARTGMHELFLAAALLLVIGIAVLMSFVGLSPALGTFLAGVLLAESEYRHELVSDLDPFKGLLLGVFFITVGAGMEFELLASQPAAIAAMTGALIMLKAAILLGLATAFGMTGRARWLFTFSLAQSGEFAFVLLAYATSVFVVPGGIAATASLVVALSMLATPLIMIVFERYVSPRVTIRRIGADREEDEINEEAPVIIAGMGRFGQIVQRLLVMDGYRPVVLDNSAEHIDGLRKFGIQVYYGNALRPGLLEAAGIARAKLLVVATDNRERAVELVHHVKQRYPHVHIIARAASREHVYQLRAAGADSAIRELFGSSLEAAKQSLEVLGEAPERAQKKAQAFARHDEESLRQLFEVWDADVDVFDNEAYVERARSRVTTLAELMAEDVGVPDPPQRPADEPKSGG